MDSSEQSDETSKIAASVSLPVSPEGGTTTPPPRKRYRNPRLIKTAIWFGFTYVISTVFILFLKAAVEFESLKDPRWPKNQFGTELIVSGDLLIVLVCTCFELIATCLFETVRLPKAWVSLVLVFLLLFGMTFGSVLIVICGISHKADLSDWLLTSIVLMIGCVGLFGVKYLLMEDE